MFNELITVSCLSSVCCHDFGFVLNFSFTHSAGCYSFICVFLLFHFLFLSVISGNQVICFLLTSCQVFSGSVRETVQWLYPHQFDFTVDPKCVLKKTKFYISGLKLITCLFVCDYFVIWLIPSP